MTRKMIPTEKVFAEWHKDPTYVEAYDALDEEFSLASMLIDARAKAGLTQEQITSVADWREHPDIFEARDRAVLEFVEETAKTFRVSNKTFSTIQQYLSESEMVDLALVVGWYLLCASVIVPFEIEPESLE